MRYLNGFNSQLAFFTALLGFNELWSSWIQKLSFLEISCYEFGKVSIYTLSIMQILSDFLNLKNIFSSQDSWPWNLFVWNRFPDIWTIRSFVRGGVGCCCCRVHPRAFFVFCFLSKVLRWIFFLCGGIYPGLGLSKSDFCNQKDFSA